MFKCFVFLNKIRGEHGNLNLNLAYNLMPAASGVSLELDGACWNFKFQQYIVNKVFTHTTQYVHVQATIYILSHNNRTIISGFRLWAF